MQHNTAQGEAHFAQQDILGDTFSLGDATFLFYVNKVWERRKAEAYLSTLTINLSDEHRLAAFI